MYSGNTSSSSRRDMNTAYNASIEFSLRMQKVLFPVVVATTLIASAMFSAAGLDKKESIYVLLGYLIVLQWIYDFAARRARIADAKTLEEEPELQLPYFDDARPYVFIWLIWWIATMLLFNAKIVYAHGLLAQLALVTFVLLFVLLRYIVQLDYNNLWISVLRGVLRFMSLVLVFVPSKQWSPHHTSGLDSFIRVSAFFITIIALQVIISNYAERSTDILVMVWWILITPWHISLIVLALMIFIIFYSQTRRISFASFDASAAAMQTMAPLAAQVPDRVVIVAAAAIAKPTTPTNTSRVVSTSTTETMSLPSAVAIKVHQARTASDAVHPLGLSTAAATSRLVEHQEVEAARATRPHKAKRQTATLPQTPARSTLDGDAPKIEQRKNEARAARAYADQQNEMAHLYTEVAKEVALEALPVPPTVLVPRPAPPTATAAATTPPKEAEKVAVKTQISFV